MCGQHGEEMGWFCVTCQKLACYSCSTLGPHSNNFHQMTSLEGYIRQNLSYLGSQINQLRG